MASTIVLAKLMRSGLFRGGEASRLGHDVCRLPTMANLRNPHSFLLVDDDKELGFLLATLIRLLIPSATVWSAFDGGEGVTLALLHRPSVIVLDLEMPILSGEAAAVRIRDGLGSACGVLVAVSGNPQRLSRCGDQASFDHCFLKPVPIQMLLGALGM